MKLIHWIALLALVFSVCACDEGSDGDSTGDGDGSCDNWKDAYCEFSQSCDSLSWTQCRTQIETVECSSTADLDRCAMDLSDGCTTPSRCDFKDVADTATARARCNTFLRSYCGNYMGCQPTAYSDISTCMSTVDLQIGCDDAYAVSAKYDQCLRDLNAGSCGQYLPSSCEDVVFIQ